MDPIAAKWTAGTVLLIGRAAGVQFGGERAVTLRVVSVDQRPTSEGAAWVTGHVLNPAGDATARRELYIDCTSGVRVLVRRGALASPSRARLSATTTATGGETLDRTVGLKIEVTAGGHVAAHRG